MFTAIVNTPGYMPDVEQPSFPTALEAWSHLASEREWALTETDSVRPDETVNRLWDEALRCDEYESVGRDEWGLPFDGTGVVYGPTPGYTGRHDLGLAYEVVSAGSDWSDADDPYGDGSENDD